MFQVGRVCIKLAGRDAGKKCVVVDVLEGRYVMIEGQTRRRKCNVLHLEPLDEVLDIEKNANHDIVMKALGHEPIVRKTKAKTEKPKKGKKAPKREAKVKKEKASKKTRK
jgi:large subunit ribosomal protein L14e